MKIPFFDYPALYLNEKQQIDRVLQTVLGKGAYILQQELKDFEEALADFCGAKHVIGVGNGTDALWLSLMTAGVGEGDEVLVPSHTYVASPASIRFVGAKPVLVECAEDHLMNPDKLESTITGRTRVIMPVQLNGRTCQMDSIQEVADKYGLIIIEDAAQGLGSRYKNQMAGTFGLAGTYSFYPAKVLGCFGDGGAVVTNDDEIAKTVRLLRDHGRDENGEVQTWGFNSRLDNIQAAILLEKLKTFSEAVERRREIATIYHDALSDIEDLVLPPGPGESKDHYDTFQNYEIESNRRDQLRSFLAKHGVGTSIQWGGRAVHQIEGLNFENVRLPHTDHVFERCMLLPMHTALQDAEVAYVCQKIRRFHDAD